MPLRSSKPLIFAFVSTALALAVPYVVYRLLDPLTPHRFAIAAGAPGSVYDSVANRYARILARDGVTLEVRNAAGALEDLELLRNPAQACRRPSPRSRRSIEVWAHSVREANRHLPSTA